MKYAPYLLIALVVGAIWLQHREIKSLSSDLGIAQEQVKTLKENQTKIENDIQQAKVDRLEHESRLNELDKTNRVKKTNLDKMKGRENTLLSKPKLTEKLINESFRKSADELSCNTGASERCAN